MNLILDKRTSSVSEGQNKYDLPTWGKRRLPPTGNLPKTIQEELPMHILIIDDDETNNYILTRRIKAMNQQARFTIAMNGVDALIDLGKIKQENTPFPDFILVDIDMPYMDGFEFLKFYEKDFFHENQQSEVIIVTSSSLNVDQQRAQEFQFVSQFVNKPFPLSIIQ